MESKKSSSSSSSSPKAVEKSSQIPTLQISTEHSQLQAESFKRTGTIWTAMAHIITGVIGAGVLSLVWSTAQLGWIAGPLAIVAFAAITQISTLLVCDCYTTSRAATTLRNRSFIQVANFYLGRF